jgi:hypothetical protein
MSARTRISRARALAVDPRVYLIDTNVISEARKGYSRIGFARCDTQRLDPARRR